MQSKEKYSAHQREAILIWIGSIFLGSFLFLFLFPLLLIHPGDSYLQNIEFSILPYILAYGGLFSLPSLLIYIFTLGREKLTLNEFIKKSYGYLFIAYIISTLILFLLFKSLSPGSFFLFLLLVFPFFIAGYLILFLLKYLNR